jgi:hypothetical protein
MNWKAIWHTIRTNPVCVFAWTSFSGALATQLYTALQPGGHFDWSVQSWEKMLTAAAATALISLVHLYTPVPGTNPNQ